MNSTENKNVPAETEADNYGPAMSALLPKERAFVLALLEGRSGAQAAREAGYGNEDGTTTAESFARIAHRALQRPRIIAALAEQTKLSIRSLGPAALAAAKNLITNTCAKDHGRAVFNILDRIDPPQANTSVNVEVTHKAEDLMGGIFRYYQKLLSLGLDRQKIHAELGNEYLNKCEEMAAEGGRLPVIDASFQVLEATSDEQPLTVEDL